MDTIEKIIRSHDACYICLLNSRLERREIQLMKGPLINIRRHTMAVPLLIIASKMLDTSHDILTLHSPDIIGCYLPCQIRVFSKILKIASTHRRPIDIYSWPQKDVYASGTCILSESYTHLFNKFPIPGRGSCHTTWIKSALRVISYSLRSVNHLHSRKTQTFQRPYIPAFISTYICNLFIQGHLGHDFCRPILMFLSYS